MIRNLAHICAHIFGPALLIDTTRLDALLVGLNAAMFQRGSTVLAAEAIELASLTPGDGERPRGYRIDRGVATLPVHGVLVDRAGQINADSTPLQSYENLSRVLASAHRDPRVRGILLDVDSPGGEADGVFDLADRITEAGKTKPIWAVANHSALSAAYMLASAAELIWTTKTAALGSLGVVALHRDQSELDAQEGLKYTYLFKGRRKIDGNPHAPLAPEAQSSIQTEVERVYEMLIDQVARQRRVEPSRLRDTEAEVYYGGGAIDHGLADRLGTLSQAHAALVEHITPKGRTSMNGSDAPDAGIATEASDNVVQLRIAAAAEARLAAQETINICQLAARGQPWGIELAGQLLAENAPRDVVIRRAQERQAAEAQSRQLVAIDTSATADRAGRQRRAEIDLDRAATERFRAQSLGLMPGETVNPTAVAAGRGS